jgi:hypothetical protein
MDLNFVPTPKVTPADLIAEYLSLRDEKKVAEEKMAAFLKQHYTSRLYEIELLLLDFLNTTGQTTSAGPAGTAYKKTDTSVTVADARAFREYVLETGRFDLIDWRVSKTPVMEQVSTEGTLPPGINFTQRVSVGIRRK